MVNLEEFLVEFQDHLAPRLDTYEQAIYLYVFRHSRLLNKEEIVIGFKSARARMACGVGTKGKPMSENTAYEKLQSLKAKGCLEIISSERSGRRLRLFLPTEIAGITPAAPSETSMPDIEDIDFFEIPANRAKILSRESGKCFYCARMLSAESHVIEHVVSRPEGNNSYRNLVAACRECNNRKNKSGVEDFIRQLYREKILSSSEFQDRIDKLSKLKNGDLKPEVGSGWGN